MRRILSLKSLGNKFFCKQTRKFSSASYVRVTIAFQLRKLHLERSIVRFYSHCPPLLISHSPSLLLSRFHFIMLPSWHVLILVRFVLPPDEKLKTWLIETKRLLHYGMKNDFTQVGNSNMKLPSR
jgi:hypothetical protein